MKTRTKTFQEGDEVGIPMMWTNDIVWDYSGCNDFVHPSEADYYLKNKITITIKIYDENDRKRNR
jgi:hypothetical protein